MSPPLVSVVMPAYNHERYVAAAIGSVLAQTFEDWELVIVDDGSTDATVASIEGFRDPRVRLTRQANAGSHAALNRGISLARGRYIGILNSDDEYDPGRLARLVEVAATRNHPALLTTAVTLIDAAGRPLPVDHWWNRMYRDMLAVWDETHSALATLQWGNFTVSTSNLFFDRSLLERHGGFRHFRYVPDWEFALRIARSPTPVLLLRDESLLRYRLHGSNTILGGTLRNHIEAIRVLRLSLGATFGSDGARALLRLHYLQRVVRQRVKQEAVLAHEAQAQELRSQLEAGWREAAELYAQSSRREAELDRALDAALTNLWTGRDGISMLQEEKRQLQRALMAAQTDRLRLRNELASLAHLPLWRRWLARQPRLNGVRAALAAARRLRLRHAGWLGAARAAFGILRRQGLAGWRRRWEVYSSAAPAATSPEPNPAVGSEHSPHCSAAYALWLEAEQRDLDRRRARFAGRLAGPRNKPRFSILVPVHNTDPTMLEAMFASVYGQWYPDWELCLCDDASRHPATLAVLDRHCAPDSPHAGKIRRHVRTECGHIALASNDALALAGGDFAVLLDHDDVLAPHALASFVEAIDAAPEVDLLYSDEDKLDTSGLRCLPFFKPDWSPALLSVQNYLGHALCVRRAAMQAIGGFRAGTEGSQDYDLILRLAERTPRIRHVPAVLYHWRLHDGSTSNNAGAKPYAHEAGRRVLGEFLARRYPDHFERVDDGEHLFTYDPRFRVPANCLASIVIPTRDRVDLLSACIDSILDKSSWPDFEVLILDNNSTERATQAYFDALRQRDDRVRILPAAMPFNWSRLNNLAAYSARGDVLIFLNNDTEVISPDWLERLMGHALLPDVATVGARLVYSDGSLQHAGVVVGMGGWADHCFKGMTPVHFPSPFVSPVLTRNVLASTGACVAVERRKFNDLGGFDEGFEICGSDVELGLRAHRRGWQNVYLASVHLFHHESKTRSGHVPEMDFVHSDMKYAPFRLAGDPFYNANLDKYCTAPTPLYPEPAPETEGN